MLSTLPVNPSGTVSILTAANPVDLGVGSPGLRGDDFEDAAVESFYECIRKRHGVSVLVDVEVPSIKPVVGRRWAAEYTAEDKQQHYWKGYAEKMLILLRTHVLNSSLIRVVRELTPATPPQKASII
ncbi:MAG: hypothetical protein QXV86_03195 [Candidatus Caldarchaeum sp.]